MPGCPPLTHEARPEGIERLETFYEVASLHMYAPSAGFGLVSKGLTGLGSLSLTVQCPTRLLLSITRSRSLYLGFFGGFFWVPPRATCGAEGSKLAPKKRIKN